jgi:demethylmenaquinone methyltransferase/2-methoxy-6-polyprenyl-1,4-benzoquinol methylase
MAPRRNAGPGPGGLPSPLPAEAEKTARVRAMFDTIAPRYDLVNRLMTFGLDQRWRRATVDALALPAGARILDLACGTGDLSRAATTRGHSVVGTDLSAGMLAANRARTPLVESDGGRLPFAAGAFDGLVCGYALRNFTDLDATLAEASRVLRPGGRLAVLEVDAPTSGLWRFGFDVWFNKVVPVLGGVLSDRAAYRYLPASVAYLPQAPVLRRMLIAAGFSAVGIRPLAGGLSQLVVATRVDPPPPPFSR